MEQTTTNTRPAAAPSAATPAAQGAPATPQWQDFGYMNGWRDGVPEPVRRAWNDKEARWSVRQIGRCVEEYRCEKHGVIYRVDSSD